MIIFGYRLFGRVDRVPGVGYLATQFFHIWFFLLGPVETFIVPEGAEGLGGLPAQALPRRYSWKSVFIAYARACLAVMLLSVGLVAPWMSVSALTTPDQSELVGGSVVGLLGLMILGVMFGPVRWRVWVQIAGHAIVSGLGVLCQLRLNEGKLPYSARAALEGGVGMAILFNACLLLYGITRLADRPSESTRREIEEAFGVPQRSQTIANDV